MHTQAHPVVNELRAKSGAVLARLRRQLDDVQARLERAEAPGQWITCGVLCHLLLEPGFAPVSFGYLETLGDADLVRKARIPLFKQLTGTDEITVPVFVGAMFDDHWNDHAGQLAKIRSAAGLPAVG